MPEIDQQHLLWFMEEKDAARHAIRVSFGTSVADVVLKRPAQFKGQMTIRCSVQVANLPRQTVDWIDAFVRLIAKDHAEYSFEQNDHHSHVYSVCRRGALVEADYQTSGELACAVVTFAVELLFYLQGIIRESYAWQGRFGGATSPTPEDVYKWLEGSAGLQALR
jgi:hypothetical protein